MTRFDHSHRGFHRHLLTIFAFALGWMTLPLLKATEPENFVFQAEQGTATIFSAPAFLADQESREISGLLSGLLKEITGHETERAEGPAKGIVLAIAADFPEIATEASLDPGNPFGREDYLIRSSKERLLILGATPLGVRRAVADLLHRWGYRQFFPGKAWEIVPKSETLTLRADEVQRPAYHVRDLFTVNFLPGEKEDYNRWLELNRMGRGFQLNTRHSYLAIYRRNQEAFEGKPEYFAVVDGEPQDATRKKFKFNAANPDLLKLLVADAKNLLSAQDAEDSISMDPSDYGAWDNSGQAFETIGSASNQAVTMANAVAREAAAPLHKYVGIYAYYDHQWPPEIAVEPNIIVSFATRFLRPDQDLSENIRKWKAKGVVEVGIRDYSSYWNWDFAMPGRALGGNLAYLQQYLPEYRHKTGAKFYTSETQSAWGAYGLGFYMTTRLLWNPGEDPKAIVGDFLDKAFGPAAEPMGRFYTLLNGEDSVLARYTRPSGFYAPLLEAMAAARGREDVRQRIGELMAYIHYMELFANLEKAREVEKPEALLALCDWVLRISPMQMVPTRAILLRSNNGLRAVYPNLPFPSPEECQAMLANVPAHPVTLEELTTLASASMAKDGATPAPPPLRPAKQATTSPWVRNSAAFVFPLEANHEATATLRMRRFGFSGYPRYVVRDVEGAIIERGQMEGEETVVKITASKAGNYTLVMESTLNLVQCRSDRSFYLEPAFDSGRVDAVSYTGSFYVAVPAGTETEFAIGGQGGGEKIGASIHLAKNTLANGRGIDGLTPLVQTIKATPEPAVYEIRIRKPTSGRFEDFFFKFNGSYTSPIALTPDGYTTTTPHDEPGARPLNH